LAQKEESDVHVSRADAPALEIPAPVDNGGDVAGERLIIVDDDSDHTQSLERVLSRKGIKTECFTAIGTAIDVIIAQPVAAVLCDAHMPDGGAKRLLQLLATSGKQVRLAVMSGEVNDELLYRFAALGAREFFAKPIEVEDLTEWVREAERGVAVALETGCAAT
jgi:DNA-binding NtrC family response regulator